jgi:hypothetical protein
MPGVSEGTIRAVIRGHQDALRKRRSRRWCGASRRRPTLERERLLATFEFIRTPEVAAGGFGALTTERVRRAIETIRNTVGITAALPADQFYLPQLLPPADQMRLA